MTEERFDVDVGYRDPGDRWWEPEPPDEWPPSLSDCQEEEPDQKDTWGPGLPFDEEAGW